MERRIDRIQFNVPLAESLFVRRRDSQLP
jgi:hypothetical protein